MGPIVAFAGVVAFVVAVMLAIFGLIYTIDRSRHGGIGAFRRRRIMRTGIAAMAWVIDETVAGVSGGRSSASVVKDVELDVRPPDAGAYRTRTKLEIVGVFSSLAIERGAKVPVRIDPGDRSVVLVDLDALRAQRAAAR